MRSTQSDLSMKVRPLLAGLSRRLLSMSSIMLWMWTRSQNIPSTPSGFQCLKRIIALSRSSPTGLSFGHLGNILPLNSQVQECQNTLALCSIILLAHSSTSVLLALDSESVGVKTSANSSFALMTLILACLSPHWSADSEVPSLSSISNSADRNPRFISHWVPCKAFSDSTMRLLGWPLGVPNSS